MTDEERFPIDVGGTPVSGAYARPAAASATVVIAHGAGAGMDHPFLTGFSRALNALGIATLRFNFAYREAGRRFPDRPPAAITAWRAAVNAAAERSEGEPVWAAGKSFGGRMASMTAAEGMDAAGLVFLGYPLHPPGRPDALRDAHLYGIEQPMLFLQGRNDPFASGGLLDSVVERIGPPSALTWIENADHSFAVKGVKRSADAIGAGIAPLAASFLQGASTVA